MFCGLEPLKMGKELLLAPFSKQLLANEQALKKRDIEANFHIFEIWQYYSNPLIVKETSNGDSRLKALYDAMAELNVHWKRSKHQIDFHRYFVSSLLTKIYGEDIYLHYNRLCNEFGVEDLNPNSVIIAPRRFGKTTAVAFFCACWLMTQPNAKIVVYSTAKRLSIALLEKTKQMVALLQPKKMHNNQEVLIVENPYGEARLSSYPSNENIRKIPLNRIGKKKKKDGAQDSTLISFIVFFSVTLFNFFTFFTDMRNWCGWCDSCFFFFPSESVFA